MGYYTISNMFTNQAKFDYYPPDGTEQTDELESSITFDNKETTFTAVLEIKLIVKNPEMELMATSSTEFHYTFEKSVYPNIDDVTNVFLHKLIKTAFHKQYYQTVIAMNDDIRDEGFQEVEMCSAEKEKQYVDSLIKTNYNN